MRRKKVKIHKRKLDGGERSGWEGERWMERRKMDGEKKGG